MSITPKIRIILSAICTAILVAILNRGSPYFHLQYLLYFIPPILAAIFFIRYFNSSENIDGREFIIIMWIFLTGILVYLISSTPDDNIRFYFSRWFPSKGGEYPWYRAGIVRFCVLWLIFTILLFYIKKPYYLVLFILLISAISCATTFWRTTGGNPLYNDDHPAFMHRLWNFSRIFPAMSYYDPFWNGGVVNTTIVGSGLIPAGLIFTPFLQFFSMEQVHIPLLTAIYIFVIPCIAFFSVRLMGGNKTSALIGSVLSLGVSDLYFLWLLHFGTIGAIFCQSFIMLVTACLYRIFWLDKYDWRIGTLFIFAVFFLFSWPGNVFVAPVLAIAVFFNLYRLTKEKFYFLLKIALIVALLLTPLILTVVLHTRAEKFITVETTKPVFHVILSQGWKTLRNFLWTTNPALVFFGFAGLWFFADRGTKTLFGPIIILLMVIGSWGEHWKPQFQLTRELLSLCYVAVLPAALTIGTFLEQPTTTKTLLGRGMLVALVAITGINTVRFYKNNPPLTFRTMPQYMREFVEWTKNNLKQDRRLLFAGKTVHGYGGGHVAFLPVMTSREMMACDFYHFSPKLQEYEYPPREFRKNEQDISRWMELYNVGAVVTYHEYWKTFFRNHPEMYEESGNFGESVVKTVFIVKRDYGIFLKNSGKVKASLNRLEVSIDNPNDIAVIKYNWNKGLYVNSPAKIYPYDAGNNVHLIGIHPNGCSTVIIRYRVFP
jgi:hypothetical protein